MHVLNVHRRPCDDKTLFTFIFYSITALCYLCYCTDLQKKPVEGFSAGLIDDDDIFRWEVLIMGPPDTF